MRLIALFPIFAACLPFVISARLNQARGPARLHTRDAKSPTSLTNEAHTARGLINTNLDLDVGTCVRLTESFNLTESSSNGSNDVSAALKTGDCICIDAADSAGLSGVGAGVTVVTSGDLTFDGNVATKIAEAVSPKQSDKHPSCKANKRDRNQITFPGTASSVYDFTFADICLQASISIANSHHAFTPSRGGCCQRGKSHHKPPTRI